MTYDMSLSTHPDYVILYDKDSDSYNPGWLLRTPDVDYPLITTDPDDVQSAMVEASALITVEAGMSVGVGDWEKA